MSAGETARRPSSSSISPAMSLSKVVLPTPLRPISASRSRASMVRSRPRNSQLPPWRRPAFSRVRMGSGMIDRSGPGRAAGRGSGAGAAKWPEMRQGQMEKRPAPRHGLTETDPRLHSSAIHGNVGIASVSYPVSVSLFMSFRIVLSPLRGACRRRARPAPVWKTRCANFRKPATSCRSKRSAARVMQQVRGDYVGVEFDAATLTYRFRFLVDGNVINVDVDARTGQRRRARSF